MHLGQNPSSLTESQASFAAAEKNGKKAHIKRVINSAQVLLETKVWKFTHEEIHSFCLLRFPGNNGHNLLKVLVKVEVLLVVQNSYGNLKQRFVIID